MDAAPWVDAPSYGDGAPWVDAPSDGVPPTAAHAAAAYGHDGGAAHGNDATAGHGDDAATGDAVPDGDAPSPARVDDAAPMIADSAILILELVYFGYR